MNLADYMERTRSAGETIIELADDVTISIPPAELWPDAAFDELAAGRVAATVDLILGAEQNAIFIAAGGNWRILNGIIREQQGLDVGESQASSGS